MPSVLDTTPSVRPVTIRQLLEATRPYSDAPFSIDSAVVDHVSIVAHVITVRTYDSCVVFTLEDGTSRGQIAARQWRSDIVDPLPDDDSGLYVHVVGQLDQKVFMGARNALNVRRIHRVTDIADQLFFHLMETAFVTLCHERGPPPASALASAGPRHLSNEPKQSGTSMSPPTTPARATARRNGQPSSVPTTPDASMSASPLERSSQASSSLIPRQITPSTPTQQTNRAPVLQSPVPTTPIGRSILTTPLRAPRSPAREPSPEVPVEEERRTSPVAPKPPPVAASAPSTPLRTSARRQSGIKRDPYANLTALQRAILLQILNAQPSNEGASVFSIVRGVSHHNVTADQIGDALDFLADKEYIENTIDSSHYAIKTSHYPRSP